MEERNRMKKLTKQQIEEIIYMKNKEVPTKEIMEKFKINKNTIYWHTNEDFKIRMREYQRSRYNKMTKKQKRKYFNKKKDYQRDYHKRRYDSDEEFRKKQIESSKEWQKKKINQGI